MRTNAGIDRSFRSIPTFLVAVDLLSQAEHGPGVAILVTWYEPLLKEVQDALEKRLVKLGRGDLARDSLERFSQEVSDERHPYDGGDDS